MRSLPAAFGLRESSSSTAFSGDSAALHHHTGQTNGSTELIASCCTNTEPVHKPQSYQKMINQCVNRDECTDKKPPEINKIKATTFIFHGAISKVILKKKHCESTVSTGKQINTFSGLDLILTSAVLPCGSLIEE